VSFIKWMRLFLHYMRGVRLRRYVQDLKWLS
jgi:hypothetical protein